MSKYSGGVIVVLAVICAAQTATLDPTGTCDNKVFTTLRSLTKLSIGDIVNKEVHFLGLSDFLVYDAFDECRLLDVKMNGASAEGVVRIYKHGQQVGQGARTVFTESNGQLRASGFLGDNRITIVKCAPKNDRMLLIYWCRNSGSSGKYAYSIGVRGNSWTENDYKECIGKLSKANLTRLK